MKKILIILVVLSLSGCSLAMRPEERAKIHTIYVDKNVTAQYPEFKEEDYTHPFLFTTAISTAVLFRFPAVIYMDVISVTGHYGSYLSSHHIDIKKIFRGYLIQELKAKGPFTVVDSDGADATIEIDIDRYGFQFCGEDCSNVFDFKSVRPYLQVELNIIDKNGKVIWSGNEFLEYMSPYTDIVSLGDVRTKPVVAEKSLRQASKIVAKELVSEMLGFELSKKDLAHMKIKNSELVSNSQLAISKSQVSHSAQR